MSAVYRHADKSLKRLYKLAEALFQRLAITARWDEINVISTVKAQYRELDGAATQEYEKIAQAAYEDAKAEIVKVLPEKESDLTGLRRLFVLALLSNYDAKTEYRYDSEWQRKSDRMAESLMAVTGADLNSPVLNTPAIRAALQRGLNLMNGQFRNMADTVTDEARIEAFAQAGIKEVVWHTQQDERVCEECRERDNHVYPLYGVPPKHRRCRCWLSARIGSNP